VPMTLMKRCPNIPHSFLRQLVDNPDLYKRFAFVQYYFPILNSSCFCYCFFLFLLFFFFFYILFTSEKVRHQYPEAGLGDGRDHFPQGSISSPQRLPHKI
jgi:hypothetical protein